MGTSVWRKLRVFCAGPLGGMENSISGCQHLALDKMKVGKRKYRAENIKLPDCVHITPYWLLTAPCIFH